MRCHGIVTRDSHTPVTPTRPDPTRPTVVTVVCSSGEDVESIHQTVTRGLTTDGRYAADIGGGR